MSRFIFTKLIAWHDRDLVMSKIKLVELGFAKFGHLEPLSHCCKSVKWPCCGLMPFRCFDFRQSVLVSLLDVCLRRYFIFSN